jgi:hypothetical protein
MNAILTRPLGCDDWSIVETLFGPRGACGGCWCMWWRVPMGGRTWEAAKGEPNGKAFRKLVALVAAAVELAPERGATEVEEYPQSMAPGERQAGALVWTGVASLYEPLAFAGRANQDVAAPCSC